MSPFCQVCILFNQHFCFLLKAFGSQPCDVWALFPGSIGANIRAGPYNFILLLKQLDLHFFELGFDLFIFKFKFLVLIGKCFDNFVLTPIIFVSLVQINLQILILDLQFTNDFILVDQLLLHFLDVFRFTFKVFYFLLERVNVNLELLLYRNVVADVGFVFNHLLFCFALLLLGIQRAEVVERGRGRARALNHVASCFLAALKVRDLYFLRFGDRNTLHELLEFILLLLENIV